ncbi:MAG: DUF2256 domain-containing protein [Hyphomonadaceae bacterium]|nr:DUF2256 domain-containing protein [Hyphomonadaceae bacterium]OUX93090.1 MAG: DUF2256 domain-containing protein [Hyphomonas sp. TMED17]
MPRHQTSSLRPEKNCVRCQRPFSWRKKWEKDWENVRYCSKRCRNSPVSQTDAKPPERT